MSSIVYLMSVSKVFWIFLRFSSYSLLFFQLPQKIFLLLLTLFQFDKWCYPLLMMIIFLFCPRNEQKVFANEICSIFFARYVINVNLKEPLGFKKFKQVIWHLQLLIIWCTTFLIETKIDFFNNTLSYH